MILMESFDLIVILCFSSSHSLTLDLIVILSLSLTHSLSHTQEEDVLLMGFDTIVNKPASKQRLSEVFPPPKVWFGFALRKLVLYSDSALQSACGAIVWPPAHHFGL